MDDPSSADARRLVYVSDALPGIRRVRRNGRFAYRDPCGRPLRDRETLARIARLAIPPAYEDVWICVDALGHLQATGRDARGRAVASGVYFYRFEGISNSPSRKMVLLK